MKNARNPTGQLFSHKMTEHRGGSVKFIGDGIKKGRDLGENLVKGLGGCRRKPGMSKV